MEVATPKTGPTCTEMPWVNDSCWYGGPGSRIASHFRQASDRDGVSRFSQPNNRAAPKRLSPREKLRPSCKEHAHRARLLRRSIRRRVMVGQRSRMQSSDNMTSAKRHPIVGWHLRNQGGRVFGRVLFDHLSCFICSSIWKWACCQRSVLSSFISGRVNAT